MTEVLKRYVVMIFRDKGIGVKRGRTVRETHGQIGELKECFKKLQFLMD